MLQKFLNKNGFIIAATGAGSVGNETMYFGNATLQAIIKFQRAQGINPALGYVGSITRGVLGVMTL